MKCVVRLALLVGLTLVATPMPAAHAMKWIDRADAYGCRFTKEWESRLSRHSRHVRLYLDGGAEKASRLQMEEEQENWHLQMPLLNMSA
jgi:hypothetical protein